MGLCYIYIKVPIIAFVELGIFTAFCGLWIDACSLVRSLFTNTDLSNMNALINLFFP